MQVRLGHSVLEGTIVMNGKEIVSLFTGGTLYCHLVER